ncbi:HPr family phosphocarrier protein [bacterium]|nr:HPr family phosphocarrier protein [bacterium]
MTQSFERDVVIKNKLGIHARPASMLVQLSNKFKCDIYISKDSMSVSGKSIMGVMTLAASRGTKLKIRAVGEDAEQAVNKLIDLFEQKFGEK